MLSSKNERTCPMRRQTSNARRGQSTKLCIPTGNQIFASQYFTVLRTSDSQPETNGGWVKDPEDTDDSSSVSDSSESRSVKSDSEDADALIDSSDDDFPQVRQMRSQTCPNLSDSVNLALNREEVRSQLISFVYRLLGSILDGSVSSCRYSTTN